MHRVSLLPPAMTARTTGHGYWLLQADGHIRTFGDARSYGDASASRAPIVAFTVMPKRTPGPIARGM